MIQVVQIRGSRREEIENATRRSSSSSMVPAYSLKLFNCTRIIFLSLSFSLRYRERENFSYVCVSASFRARYFHVVACMEDFGRVKYFSGSREDEERETVSPRSGYFLRLHSSYRRGERRKVKGRIYRYAWYTRDFSSTLCICLLPNFQNMIAFYRKIAPD